jgi:hypothetical protein
MNDQPSPVAPIGFISGAFGDGGTFMSQKAKPTRYQRRSGSLPHLEDQANLGMAGTDLPSPISSHLRPMDRIRNLFGS